MNSYIKWFLKLLVFCVLFFVGDKLIGVGYKYLQKTASEKSPQAMIVDYSLKQVNADVLIFGASEAAHSYVTEILRDSLQMSVYNCGNDGKPAYYHIAIIRYILSRYTPKLIIWSISPMWLAEDNNDRLSVLNPYYDEIPACKEMVDKKSKYESIKCRSDCYKFNSLLYDYMTCIIVPKNNFGYGHYLPLYGTDNNLALQDRDLEKAFRYSADLAQEFDKTLELCNKKGVKVALVFTPRYEKSSYEHLKNYKVLKEISQKNDIPLIEDYYRNPIINQPHNYKDFAHLNDNGAKMFSSMLVSKLTNWFDE